MAVTILAIVFLCFMILIAIIGYKAITRRQRTLTQTNTEKVLSGDRYVIGIASLSAEMPKCSDNLCSFAFTKADLSRAYTLEMNNNIADRE